MSVQLSALESTVQSQLKALESTVLAQSGPVQQHSASIEGQDKALQLLTAQVCSYEASSIPASNPRHCSAMTRSASKALIAGCVLK